MGEYNARVDGSYLFHSEHSKHAINIGSFLLSLKSH